VRQLVVFIRAVWDENMTESSFLERRKKDMSDNPYAKTGGLPIAVALENNKIIGHHAGTPVKVWLRGKEVINYWLSGLYVLPEGRGKGVAKVLQGTTNRLPMATSFWVVEATLRVKKRLGWTVVGKIPEYIKILDPQMILNSTDYNQLPKLRFRLDKVLKFFLSGRTGLASALFKVLAKTYNFIVQGFSSNHSFNSQIKIVHNFDSGVDQLWDKNKKNIKYSQIRDSSYMNWKFNHSQGWIKIIAEKENTTVGYAILSLKDIKRGKHIRGLRSLSIIDIFWDFERTEVLWDLLTYIEKMGQENRASFLLCSINNKTAQHTLLKNGYCRMPGMVYFGFHSNEYNRELSASLKDWFVTRGDGDAAGSLGPE